MQRRQFLTSAVSLAGCLVSQPAHLTAAFRRWTIRAAQLRPRIAPYCTCGCLAVAARGPLSPVTFDPAANAYNLAVTPNITLARAYCGVCGGRDGGFQAPRIGKCLCGFLESAIQEPKSAIEWDSCLHLYVLRPAMALIFYYRCPACGLPADEEWLQLQEEDDEAEFGP